jgi:phospholipid transport system substrate-binding protein
MLTRRRFVAAGLAAAVLPAFLRGAVAQDTAAAPIAALNEALIAGMKAGRSPFPQRFAALRPVVERAFDLPTVLAAVVGPRWTTLPPAQQARLLDTFRSFTVASYAANFDSFSGERLEVLPDTRMVGQDQVVATRIVQANGTPVRLDYVMRRGPQGWRAVDVLLDGSISRVAVQRSDFRSLITQGDAGALIASLNKKIADLSGGTLPAG